MSGIEKHFIGKPTGQIQERVRAVVPERFGVIAVDCAKRRSKWMLCNFYGKVVVEPAQVEHTTGRLRAMTQRIATRTIPDGGHALSIAEGLDRDRAIDESGNQLSVFGRIGARPLSLQEQRKMYLHRGRPWRVSDDPRHPMYQNRRALDAMPLRFRR